MSSRQHGRRKDSREPSGRGRGAENGRTDRRRGGAGRSRSPVENRRGSKREGGRRRTNQQDDNSRSGSAVDDDSREHNGGRGGGGRVVERRLAAEERRTEKSRQADPSARNAKNSAADDAKSKKKEAAPLLVSGCADSTISEIIAGRYIPVSTNHNRAVYKKQKPGSIDVMIYYWDDQDGSDLCGWWFGPSVGGDQVWAYHPSRTATTPPASEWNVPHDGDIDSTFSVSLDRGDVSKASRRETGEPPMKEARRGDGQQTRDISPPKDKKKSKASADAHAAFMDAYNRRLEGRSKGEDKKVDKKRGDDDRRRDDKRKREDEEEQSEVQTKKLDNIKAQEEEERRQLEAFKKKREESRKDKEEPSRGRRGDEDRSRRDNDRDRRDDDWRGSGRDGGRDRKDDDRRSKQEDSRRKDDDRRRRDEEREEREKKDRVSEDERRRREEDRRRVNESERRAKEDSMRKREDELQKRRDEKRRREDDDKRKLDDQRRREREDEDRKRKAELERRREEEARRESEQAKQRAEEEAKRVSDEQKRRDEEARALKQQKATLSVLRVLQKLSNATPDNFDELNTELESVLETELPETGPQQEILKGEANRVRDYAKQYVEQVRDQQKKVEEEKRTAQEKQETNERNARVSVAELTQLVDFAEKSSFEARDSCAPLAGPEVNSMDEPSIVRVANGVERAGRIAMTACSRCAEFLMQKKSDIDAAETIRAETTAALVALQPKIQQATRQATEAMQIAGVHKDKISRKLAASKHLGKLEALFNKYDKDMDGMLNRSEMESFAKEEYSFDLPEKNLDRICRHLFKVGRPGVRLCGFQVLKTCIGIAREEVRNAKKMSERLAREKKEREEQEARDAIINAKLEVVRKPAQQLLAELEQLAATVQAAEAAAQSLTNEASTISVKDLKARSDAVRICADPARKTLEDIQTRLAKLAEQVVELDELADIMKPDMAVLTTNRDMFDARLSTVEGIATNGRQLALHKVFAENETMRMEVAARLRVCIEAQGGKPEELYESIGPDGKMTMDAVKAYLQKHQVDISSEKLEQVFAPAMAAGLSAEDAEGRAGEQAKNLISKEEFMRVIRIFYKVTKEIILSDNLQLEQSRQIRRMDVGEVMEVHQGPMLDPSVGVYRVHGKALKDGIVGWVTVAGNQGVTFLTPGGNVFQVIKSVPLTEELKDTDTRIIKQLEEGVLLEVMDWDRTSRSALGMTRIRAKIQGDDQAVGWVTVADTNGVIYLIASS